MCLMLLTSNNSELWRGKIGMLPIERQNRIRELIRTKENIKISELSKELSVSDMTIHRDLKPLITEGLIVKTFGGIMLAQKHPVSSEHQQCIYCCREIIPRMSYRMVTDSNHIEIACCAHCGLLRHHQLDHEVVQAICHDFLRHTTISASKAWYVMNTSIDIGCCQPQVLAFELKKHANHFIKGFGGDVLSFYQAIQVLLEKMQGNENNCT